jgi:D-ribose pyranose/furanose isomerase RbsD
MKIDETNSKLKEYLISNQKTEHVKMFAETHETLKQLTSELTDVLSHPEITL